MSHNPSGPGRCACGGARRPGQRNCAECHRRTERQRRAKLKGLNGLILRLPRPVADARIKALEEAAGHLERQWTENEEEKLQGFEVAHLLRTAGQKIFEMSRKESNGSP